MTFLNNLWADLVDKRLWPVLIVLLLALVAIPLLLLKSGDSSGPSAPPIPSAAAPAASHSVVSVDSDAKQAARMSGSSHDPFRGGGPSANPQSSASSPAAGPPTGGTGPATPSTPGAGGTGSGTGATGVAGSTGGTGGGGGPTPVPSGSSGGSSSQGSVTVRFGKWGSSKLHKVAPLEALPSRQHPMVIYLGPKDGKAVFLISSDVTVGSNSDCKPSKDICQKDYVPPGTTVKVTVDYPRTYYKIKVS
jgi:hypothetical protein